MRQEGEDGNSGADSLSISVAVQTALTSASPARPPRLGTVA